MKKLTKITLILCAIILFITNVVLATEDSDLFPNQNVVLDGTQDMVNSEQNEENGIMPISEEIPEEWLRSTSLEGNFVPNDGDMFLAEESIEINQRVYGDLYLFGKNVEINSEDIDGNIFVIGEKIKISGQISSYIIALGDSIEISGTASGIYAISNSFTLTEGSQVIRDLKIISDEINIDGIVNRNVSVISENINMGINSAIYGKLLYDGNLKGNKNAIFGETVKYEIENDEEKDIQKRDENKELFSNIKDILLKCITALIFIAIISLITKNEKPQLEEMKIEDYIKDIFIGLGILVAIPILAVILFFTIIGIPFAIIGIMIYAIFVYLAKPFLCYEIARVLLKDSNSKAKTICGAVLVFFIIEILGCINIIGGLINVCAKLLGIAIELKFLSNKKDLKDKKENIEKVEDKKEEVIEVKQENKEEIKKELSNEEKETEEENKKEEN